MYFIPPLSNYTAMIVTGHPTFVSISVHQDGLKAVIYFLFDNIRYNHSLKFVYSTGRVLHICFKLLLNINAGI